jgi:single-stranded-DNA-specific exonuclease
LNAPCPNAHLPAMRCDVPAPLSITNSITGQAWRWRAASADARGGGFDEQDLLTQLLLSRGCPYDQLEAYRTPSIRAFMPDPSIFHDMDSAAARIADAVQAGETITIFGDYDVDGATSAALLIRLLRDLGLSASAYIPDRLMEGYGPSGEALVALGATGSTMSSLSIITNARPPSPLPSRWSTRTGSTKCQTPQRTAIWRRLALRFSSALR